MWGDRERSRCPPRSSSAARIGSKCARLGSAIEGWWDGARLLQATDTFQQTATRHGLDWNTALRS